MAAPSQVPVRYTSGVSTDPPYGPLANFGLPNPFFYHVWEDDFDTLQATYTQTHTGNGTIAPTAVDGGALLFTTNSSTPAGTDLASIQLPAASFTFTLGKKAFFLCRLQVSDAVNAAINVGLIQTSATPFTVTDGLYFNKASGSAANLTLTSMNASTATSVAIPTAAYNLANNTNIDLGWYVNRNGNVYAFVGSQLVGWIPQSGTGGVNAAGVSLLPVVGPVAELTGPSLTTATLNFTVAVQSGTATSKTMQVDFAMAAKER